MRDQCGNIFRQAKKELEITGLLKVDKDTIQSSTTGGGEEALASDIDKELENLQVLSIFVLYSSIILFHTFYREKLVQI